MKVAAATILSLVAVSAYASPTAYSANQEVNTHGSTIGSSANAYLEKRGGGMHGDYAQGATGADDPPPNNQNHAPPPERGHQQQYQENKGPSSLHEISQHAQSVEGGNNVESNVETAGDKSEDSDETDESESESESEGEYELGENDESGDEATESKDEESAAVQLPQYPTRQFHRTPSEGHQFFLPDYFLEYLEQLLSSENTNK
ncbi:hypothetical protein BASA82_000789 [Batrachochytrium salamandrivorans]|nr:hypothetical protein BASA82_000789 [Batrachochytrium salamandrivorans]KAH9276736.1 hypothetical protein BASA83_000871 [Batrachochytrium salamandrivorans]